MSKITSEKLRSNIASIDAKIESKHAQKKKAQQLIETVDQDVREIHVQRQHYVNLLEARGEKYEADTEVEEQTEEQADADDPQFG